KVTTTITAYDNSKRGARGGVKLQLKVSPAIMMTPFVIMDIVSTFKAIMGRPWVGQTLGVPSTIHQCFKFPYNGKILTIKSVPHIEATNMFYVEGLASTSQLKLKEAVVDILEVRSKPTTPTPQPDWHLDEVWLHFGSEQAW